MYITSSTRKSSLSRYQNTLKLVKKLGYHLVQNTAHKQLLCFNEYKHSF